LHIFVSFEYRGVFSGDIIFILEIKKGAKCTF
jgi:hypothetical protein